MTKKEKDQINIEDQELETEETAPTNEDNREPAQEESAQEETQEEVQEQRTAEEELAELEDRYLRVQAEYANYRNRTVKEKSELLKYGGERVLLAFLEIMDDFDRALENLESAESKEGIVEGINLIHNKFVNTLKSQKVEEIKVIGEDFNADIHEAVAMVPTDDKSKKGKIIDCVQKGYQLDDKVIRHPKVVVGQ
ncbi:MAG: nucleotide exchange factor GrpE [Porphyromonas sp.]|nr:nucleotide exchange factor GrpE [Porphyromonas sp.]